MAKLEQQLKAAANKADLYKKKIAQLEAKLGGGAEEESSSSSSDESSDDEDELPFDKKHLLHLTFEKPGSLGLAYAPASDNRVKVARIMPGSQAAKQKKKPKAGYFLCMVNKKRVYEVGYDKVMGSRSAALCWQCICCSLPCVVASLQEVLKHAKRPVSLTFGIP